LLAILRRLQHLAEPDAGGLPAVTDQRPGAETSGATSGAVPVDGAVAPMEQFPATRKHPTPPLSLVARDQRVGTSGAGSCQGDVGGTRRNDAAAR
jgi:hypothetical protein